MVKSIKIRDDNTFKYKNINGRIEFIEEDLYIYINRKLFRFYLKNIIKLKYKGITFKFNLIEGRIKVYEKETECKHEWNSNGECTKCELKWTSIYDGDWMTSDMLTFVNKNLEVEINKQKLLGKLLILEPATSIGDNAFFGCSGVNFNNNSKISSKNWR